MSVCVIVHMCVVLSGYRSLYGFDTQAHFLTPPLCLQPGCDYSQYNLGQPALQERERVREGERETKRKIGQPLWCTLVVLVTASLFA